MERTAQDTRGPMTELEKLQILLKDAILEIESLKIRLGNAEFMYRLELAKSAVARKNLSKEGTNGKRDPV
jgi:hypothetical protein